MLDEDLKMAIEVTDATWSWDTPPPEVLHGKKSKHKTSKQASAKKGKAMLDEKVAATPIEADIPFSMKHISMEIPRGQLVAIVGAVGSGKTSLLQGIIGEMRREGGSVKFGGSVAYCPQSAWIQVSISSL